MPGSGMGAPKTCTSAKHEESIAAGGSVDAAINERVVQDAEAEAAVAVIAAAGAVVDGDFVDIEISPDAHFPCVGTAAEIVQELEALQRTLTT